MSGIAQSAQCDVALNDRWAWRSSLMYEGEQKGGVSKRGQGELQFAHIVLRPKTTLAARGLFLRLGI